MPNMDGKNVVDLPVISQAGKFRLQMSNLKIHDKDLPLLLARAKVQLLELTNQQQQQNGNQPQKITAFEDVPLIEITLNRNNLTDASMPSIVEFLMSNTHIDSFEVLGNQLTDGSAEYIKHLITRSKLQRVKIGDNHITCRGAEIIAEGLANSHDTFVQLHIGGNAIEDAGVAAICAACADSHVEVLGLRDVGLGKKGWEAIAKSSFLGSHVNELQLKGNTMTDESANALLQAAASVENHVLSSLLSLSVACCGISTTACSPFIDFVALHPRLVSLDLSSNPIGDVGFNRLMQWLSSPTAHSMRSLNLQRTQLTVASLQALSASPAHEEGDMTTVHEACVRACCPLSGLRDIDLSFNDFTIEATPTLAWLIDACPNLERLSLHRCLVGGPSLPLLCKAVSHHPNLKDLDFSSNFSGEHGLAWEMVLSRAKKIERLLLTDNGMPTHVTTTIIQCVVEGSRGAMKNLQIGGQSKVEPLANAVTPAAHSTLSQALAKNRCDHQQPTSSKQITPTRVGGNNTPNNANNHHNNNKSQAMHAVKQQLLLGAPTAAPPMMLAPTDFYGQAKQMPTMMQPTMMQSTMMPMNQTLNQGQMIFLSSGFPQPGVEMPTSFGPTQPYQFPQMPMTTMQSSSTLVWYPVMQAPQSQAVSYLQYPQMSMATAMPQPMFQSASPAVW